MTKIPVGKILLSVLCVFLMLGAFAADYNSTHLLNPNWTGHAKFHGSMTMALGAVSALMALSILWLPVFALDAKDRITLGAAISSIYWICMVVASFFPGVSLGDPGPDGTIPFANGGMNQVDMSLMVLAVTLCIVLVERYRAARRPAA